MNKGTIQAICGDGHGKTAAAIGKAIISAEHEKNIIMIQFLKGNQVQSSAFLRRLEPEFKVFSFERHEENYGSLSSEEQEDEVINIQNGLNFAKKVMQTGECDVLILDEVLGLLDYGIIGIQELESLLAGENDEMELILTGRNFPEELYGCVDAVSCIEDK